MTGSEPLPTSYQEKEPLSSSCITPHHKENTVNNPEGEHSEPYTVNVRKQNEFKCHLLSVCITYNVNRSG
jgi:hypothetical protein